MLDLVKKPINRFSGDTAHMSFGTVRDKIRRAVRDNSWNAVRDNSWNAVRDNSWNAVRDNSWNDFTISRVVSVHLSQLVIKTYI